jgi:hypothetical protein
MSVVEEIFALKSAGTLNYERRLEKKEIGRPKPKMDLKQTTKDRGKDIHRYFKESMYDLCNWICGCSVKNAFFCYPCLLFSTDPVWAKHGVTDIKHLKDKIKKHASSAVHINCSMSYSCLGRVDIRQQLDSAYRKSVQDFNESVSKNRYILNKIIDCVKFCGVFELALRGHDESDMSNNPGIFRGLIDFVSELDSIFKEHMEKSTVFKGKSKTIQNQILDSMLAVIQTHIIQEIDQTNFVAIQVDETTDSSNKTQMIFIFRYALHGIVYERFWKFVNPPGTTAQHLTDAIKEELKLLKINEAPHKLIGQSYDGASVMSGKLGGVQIKIKETYPNAHFIHCYTHQLNLILQKAASQHKPIKIFFANLHAFSSFFGRSPKRTAVLDRVVKVRLPKAAPTRWAFNTKCVETVHSYKEDLVRCLEQIIDEEEDGKNINQATGLKRHLEDELFLFWLNFFHKIMPHVDILFKQLQMRNIDVILVKNYIMSFNSNIQKVRSAILKSEEPSTSSANTRKANGEDSKRLISLEICDIIMSEIGHRFGFSDHLMISQLFQAEKFEEYTTNFPQNILNMVKANYATVNISKLKSELEVIYCREDFRNSAGAVAILQLFINMNLSETFSEAMKLLNILCTLPMTTVESERCFSTLKRVKTFLRNTMGQSRLSALSMLSIEKTLVKNIPNFNEKVIDHFAELKERRIDLKYKHV